MTLNTTDSRIVYAGDGSTTVFAIPFKFLASGDVIVVLVENDSGLETEWTEGTEYALSGAGVDAGGTLMVSTSPTDHTPQSDQHLVIYRDPERTQGSALPLGGAFPSTVVERMADRLTMIAQRLFDIANRSVRQPDGDTVAMAVLPAKVDRAGKVLGFDPNGDPAVSVNDLGDIDDILINSAASATAAAASASAASTSASSAATQATNASNSATAAAASAAAAAASAAAAGSYDMPFFAGFTSSFGAQNLTAQTFGEIVVGRAGSFTGEVGYLATVATGTAVIVDIEKNGTTIYSTKPQFAVSTSTLTAGTLKSDGTEDFVAGDRITFKVTQIGSTVAGARMRFTALAELT
jgi:hypothetical protein